MPNVCSIHGHEKYPQIDVSIDTIRKHLTDCRAVQEIEVEGNPYEKMMVITQRVLDRVLEALNMGEESYKGDSLSTLLRAATDTLTKLDKMGRTFIPISEKAMNAFRKDYEELLQFLSSAELSLESRNIINDWLLANEGEEDE